MVRSSSSSFSMQPLDLISSEFIRSVNIFSLNEDVRFFLKDFILDFNSFFSFVSKLYYSYNYSLTVF